MLSRVVKLPRMKTRGVFLSNEVASQTLAMTPDYLVLLELPPAPTIYLTVIRKAKYHGVVRLCRASTILVNISFQVE